MEAVQQRQEQPVKTPLRLVPERPQGQFPEIERKSISESIELLKVLGLPVEIHPFRQTAKSKMGARLRNSLLRGIQVITDKDTQVMWDGRSYVIESKYDPLDTDREGFILLMPLGQNQNGASIHHADLLTGKSRKQIKDLIKKTFSGKFPANWTFPKSMHAF